jgi:phosphohistidine phosphatase
MKTILILRHAKSSWASDTLPDHERPLNKRGQRDAPRIGRLIRAEDLLPDLILTSTAVRARSTADLVAEASGYEGPIEQSRSLYMADAPAFIHALRSLTDDHIRVLIVAHNPGLEELLVELTGEDETLPTAALAVVAAPVESWAGLRADAQSELLQLWRPRELDT